MVDYPGIQTTTIMYLRTVCLRMNLRYNNIFCHLSNFTFLSLLIAKSANHKSVSGHLWYFYIGIVFSNREQQYYYALTIGHQPDLQFPCKQSAPCDHLWQRQLPTYPQARRLMTRQASTRSKVSNICHALNISIRCCCLKEWAEMKKDSEQQQY